MVAMVTLPLQEEHGHVVMLGIFDCIDDTVLVKKALLSVRTILHVGLVTYHILLMTGSD